MVWDPRGTHNCRSAWPPSGLTTCLPACRLTAGRQAPPCRPIAEPSHVIKDTSAGGREESGQTIAPGDGPGRRACVAVREVIHCSCRARWGASGALISDSFGMTRNPL